MTNPGNPTPTPLDTPAADWIDDPSSPRLVGPRVPDQTLVISATVVTANPTRASRAAEVLGRAAAELGLAGIYVNFSIGVPEGDDDEAVTR